MKGPHMAKSTITLDSIRESLDNKYGAVEVDMGTSSVQLRNALRLSKEERQKLMHVFDDVKSDDNDDEFDEDVTLDSMREMIRLVSDTKEGAEELISALGEDLAMFVEVMGEYTKDQKLGEASASEN